MPRALRKTLSNTVAAVLLAAGTAAVAAQGLLEGPDVEAVRKMNENYFRSWVEHDLDWYRQNLADSFVFVGGDGQVLGKKDFLAFPSSKEKIEKAHFEDLRIVVYPGGTAVVSANTVVRWKTGETSATRYIDVYSKVDGRWVAVCAQLTRDKNFKG